MRKSFVAVGLLLMLGFVGNAPPVSTLVFTNEISKHCGVRED